MQSRGIKFLNLINFFSGPSCVGINLNLMEYITKYSLVNALSRETNLFLVSVSDMSTHRKFSFFLFLSQVNTRLGHDQKAM